MKLLTLLIVALCFCPTRVVALPPIPHLAKGTVTAITSGRIEIALECPDKEALTSFVIRKSRTHFWKDGKRTADERPSVGESVRLYYRKESGEWVATEVSWKTTGPPRDR